ncbi:hypothetical protein NE235_21220 [Actinoallomurus spadix]|uniref:WXG100-like domain-containing protein n=1 Tax=Actinoallomurus spadix TaxID=79912 RepID=UPI002092EE9A|nr:hypothetical protein [Actinoallomurus spadix]MCO5988631.1 hypothetical protein [Actinoallomurus spadix]
MTLRDHAHRVKQTAYVYAQAEHAGDVTSPAINPAFPLLLEDHGSVAERKAALTLVAGETAVSGLSQKTPTASLQWVFELLEIMVAGCTYPRGNEKAYHQAADAIDGMADVIDDVTDVTTRHVKNVSADNIGKGIDAFVESFEVLTRGRGRLTDAAKAYRGLAAYCRYFGTEVKAAKEAFEAAAVYTAALWQVVRLLPAFMPSSVLAWLAALKETERIGVALRSILTGVRARATLMGAALAGGQSLIGNTTRAMNGLPADWTSVAKTAVFGGLGGRIFASSHLALAKSAEDGSALAGFLAHRAPGQIAVNTGVGFGINVGGDVVFNHGHVDWTKDLGMAAGMAGVMSFGHVFELPVGAGRAKELRRLSEGAFGPDVAKDVTTLAGTEHLRQIDSLVRTLAEENGQPGRLPEPPQLRAWTRNALGLDDGAAITAYDVDSLNRSLAYYRQYHPDGTAPPGVRDLHRFAETSVPGRAGGEAVQELGRVLRVHDLWHPGEPFDYVRHMHRDVQVRQLARSATGVGHDAEITQSHIDATLTKIFGHRQTEVAGVGASPVDPRRTDLSILLDALDRLDPSERRHVSVTLDDIHHVIRRYWDVPPGEMPTPSDAKALARLWSTNPGRTLDPKEAMGDIAQNLLGLDHPPTPEQTRAAGHTLSLAIDLVGEDWPLVEKYFRPMERVVRLVQAEYGLEHVDPGLVRDYARDLLREHGVGVAEGSPPSGTRSLMDAALVSEFYRLHLEARNPVEHRFMLGEVARLQELIKLEWPGEEGLPRSTSFRVLEPVAEKLTGKGDPYELLKLYRKVRADTPDGMVHSIRDLAESTHAHEKAFTDWSKFDPIEYTRRNYVGERVPAHWNPPIGAEPGRWAPGHFKLRIFDEDVKMIHALFRIFREMGIHPGHFSSILDVGSGSNLYPAAAMSAFLRPGGHITRLVYEGNSQEIAYNEVMYDFEGDGIYHGEDRYGIPQEIDTRAIWQNWRPIFKEGGAQYFPDHPANFEDADLKALRRSVVVPGDIFTLPETMRADAAVEFFAGDSMSTDPDVAFAFRSKIIDAVRPGGVVVIGNVLNLPKSKGSGAGEGYTAGEGTLFPNTAYDRARWERFLDDHPRVESYQIFETRGDQQFSAGEEGLGLVVIKLKP